MLCMCRLEWLRIGACHQTGWFWRPSEKGRAGETPGALQVRRCVLPSIGACARKRRDRHRGRRQPPGRRLGAGPSRLSRRSRALARGSESRSRRQRCCLRRCTLSLTSWGPRPPVAKRDPVGCRKLAGSLCVLVIVLTGACSFSRAVETRPTGRGFSTCGYWALGGQQPARSGGRRYVDQHSLAVADHDYAPLGQLEQIIRADLGCPLPPSRR